MTTEWIANSCLCELVVMMDGWQQRRDDLEDLLVACCSLPVYQVHYGRKTPRFQYFIKRRKKRDELRALASE